LDIALLKVQNRALVEKNPKRKEWWQMVQKIIEKQTQESLDIARVDEEAYLNELVSYWLHFKGHKYD
jgi:L-rhamnose mutarotase